MIQYTPPLCSFQNKFVLSLFVRHYYMFIFQIMNFWQWLPWRMPYQCFQRFDLSVYSFNRPRTIMVLKRQSFFYRLVLQFYYYHRHLERWLVLCLKLLSYQWRQVHLSMLSRNLNDAQHNILYIPMAAFLHHHRQKQWSDILKNRNVVLNNDHFMCRRVRKRRV